jgi:hypothetical protein
LNDIKEGDKMQNNTFYGEAFDDEKPYFCYGASLRITSDEVMDINEISQYLGISPTHSHVKGEPRFKRFWENSVWIVGSTPTINESMSLDAHIDYLWSIIKPVKAKVLKLKYRYKVVDVYCSYRTDCCTSQIEIAPSSLEIFNELDVEFQLSVIIA